MQLFSQGSSTLTFATIDFHCSDNALWSLTNALHSMNFRLLYYLKSTICIYFCTNIFSKLNQGLEPLHRFL